ncbi:radical SAM protein [Paenibacillus massiliensis]|uniref:radical SAM protein n=1 Tax=Paenibacillus massiliensis TaxID=225917 RepID=UPI00035D81FF|nr:radical SAM protein [Paenibacillus massiliensis]
MFDKARYENSKNNLKTVLNMYQSNHLFQDPTPMTVSFLVTDRCNLRCKHCFNHRTRNNQYEKAQQELTLDEIEKMSSSMGFFSSALLCGGEPFLREDLYEIVNMFRVNNNTQWFSSSTNGQLTDKILYQMERISKPFPNKSYTMNFSFEGFEEENDAIRGRGAFKRSIETWKECRKLNKIHGNIKQNIVSTMNAVNQETLPEFFEWAFETLQPDRIMLLLIRQDPRGGAHLKDIKPENYERARLLLNRRIWEGTNGDCNSPLAYIPAAQYHYISKTLQTGKRSFMCYAGKHGAFIDYDGEVNVCEVMNDERCNSSALSLGNLRDYDMNFMELWNSPQAMQVKQAVNRHPVCEHCTHETEGILPSVYFEPNFFGIESMQREIWRK